MTLNEVPYRYLAGLAALSEASHRLQFTRLVTAIDSNSLLASKLSSRPRKWASVGKLADAAANDLLNLYRKKKAAGGSSSRPNRTPHVLDVYIQQLHGFEKGILTTTGYGWTTSYAITWSSTRLDQFRKDQRLRGRLVYLLPRGKKKSCTPIGRCGGLHRVPGSGSAMAMRIWQGAKLSTDEMKQLDQPVFRRHLFVLLLIYFPEKTK